ncbi:NfeD family protein [Butyrivibrio sp. AE3009]|uniref:NfeD family protein n=1 Tax=Butyrivibrio sp. AE3009 TaxID=1280666 RepID=UPI0003B37FEA|nr:NfeD family protein [Butyrivibrio sp. AE3009]
MEMSMPLVWLAVAIVFSVIELATMGLVTIWFAAGALAALLLSMIGATVLLQVAAFLVVSVAVLLVVRPLAAKYVNGKAKKTNIDAIIGRRLVVKKEIDNLKGTGKIDMDGTTWMAASTIDNIIIPEGTTVRVVKVSGAKLIVEREDLNL